MKRAIVQEGRRLRQQTFDGVASSGAHARRFIGFAGRNPENWGALTELASIFPGEGQVHCRILSSFCLKGRICSIVATLLPEILAVQVEAVSTRQI
jgi:hypothetical protein